MLQVAALAEPLALIDAPVSIDVRVSAQEIIACHPSMLESLLVCKLRSAGIPVRGLLVFGGVASGVLSWIDDPESSARVYQWRGVMQAAPLT